MAQFETWMEGISPEHSVRQTADASLRSRLSAVRYYLPLAAKHAAENVEHVHRLRVATRRALAAIEVYRKMVPTKHRRWLRRELRTMRQVAGEARDMDVLLAGLADDDRQAVRAARQYCRKRRRHAQVPVIAIQRRMKRHGRLRHRCEKVFDGIAASQAKLAERDFGPWASLQLGRVVGRFFAAVPPDFANVADVHRFRIRGKELRYAMELLSPGLPVALRTELYPVCAEIQKRLGDANDCAVARTYFVQWEQATKGQRKSAHFARLAHERTCQLDELLADLGDWWSPAFAGRLRSDFGDLLAES